jgi:hypothetical protein
VETLLLLRLKGSIVRLTNVPKGTVLPDDRVTGEAGVPVKLEYVKIREASGVMVIGVDAVLGRKFVSPA